VPGIKIVARKSKRIRRDVGGVDSRIDLAKSQVRIKNAWSPVRPERSYESGAVAVSYRPRSEVALEGPATPWFRQVSLTNWRTTVSTNPARLKRGAKWSLTSLRTVLPVR